MFTKPIASFIVDAFAPKAFGGNPAAVCILNEEKPSEWLQHVAAEFNLSETAFIKQTHENSWSLRWFTPTCEIKLCGHATLASAHVLLHELKLPYNEIIFSTLSGDLKATTHNSQLKLDFPRVPCTLIKKALSDIAALGLNQRNTYEAGEEIGRAHV